MAGENVPKDSKLRVMVRALLASVSALYIWRVPLLLSLILFLLPAASKNALVSGLYYLPGPASPFAVGVMIAFLSVQIFIELRLLQVHGPERLGTDVAPGNDPPPRKTARWIVSLGLSIGPLLFNELQLVRLAAQEDRIGVFWLSIAGIATIAVLFGLLVSWQNRDEHPGNAPIFRFRPDAVTRPQRGPAALERWFISIVRNVSKEGKGFLIDGRLRSGYLLAAMLVGIILLAYLIGYFTGQCDNCADPGYPALAYLLLLLSLMGWFFGLVCFVLDMYRIPALTCAAVLGFAFSFIPANEHYYEIRPTSVTTLPSPESLFNGSNKGVIVVSAEGGGILAAAWATQVLTKVLDPLDQSERARFLSATRVLSGVSGGSTGLMYFETLFNRSPQDAITNAMTAAVRNAAMADGSLGWVGYGMVYYDLLRPLWPYSGYSLADRGETLERSWRAQLKTLLGNPKKLPTMRDLASGVEDGTRPLLIWNSTVADSGRPMAITNFTPPDNGDITSQYKLYPGYDLDLTTAVRMSATFPYVSPISRPIASRNPVKPDVGLCDGGYADDFGAAPVYVALESATGNFQKIPKPVLWIQIRVSEPGADTPEPIASTAVGPIWTLYGVRSTGQRARLERTNELARLQMKDKLMPIVVFQYPPNKNGAPLSWILSKEQKHQVEDGWAHSDWRDQMTEIREFLAAPPASQLPARRAEE